MDNTNTNTSLNNQEQSNDFKNIINLLHLTLFIIFNIIMLNGIKKLKIIKLKEQRNKNNVITFWISMLKELAFIPFVLLIYWFTFTFIVKVFLWFITYIINMRQLYRQQRIQMPMNNLNMRQMITQSFTTKLFGNLLIDFKIYAWLFILNLVILVSILIILLLNLKEKINDTFIDRIFFIYQSLIVISIFILFRRFAN